MIYNKLIYLLNLFLKKSKNVPDVSKKGKIVNRKKDR